LAAGKFFKSLVHGFMNNKKRKITLKFYEVCYRTTRS